MQCLPHERRMPNSNYLSGRLLTALTTRPTNMSQFEEFEDGRVDAVYWINLNAYSFRSDTDSTAQIDRSIIRHTSGLLRYHFLLTQPPDPDNIPPPGLEGFCRYHKF